MLGIVLVFVLLALLALYLAQRPRRLQLGYLPNAVSVALTVAAVTLVFAI
jgi:hypothetical protein